MEDVCGRCIHKNSKIPRLITQNTLVDAVTNGHDKCVKALIQLGARVNRLDHKRDSPLMKAVETGNETCTDLLIRAGADVNLIGHYGASAALHRAAAKGQLKCLEKLIEAGTNVNLCGTGGSALCFVLENDNQECFEKLIQAGADVNLSGGNGCTALHRAAENKSKKYLEKLIQNKANVDALDVNGKTALLKAAERNINKTNNKETETRKPSSECIQTLLKAANHQQRKTNNKTKTSNKETETRTPSSECIQTLLKAGADVNKADNNGHTPLSRATECGDQKAIEILLQNGANINAIDSNGNTSLMKAIQKRHINCSVYLINQGADVNIGNKHGVTPLIVASGICPSVIVLLIDKGANVNVKTSSGKTPLYYFVTNGQEFEIVRVCLDLLINAGADVNLADCESGTALMSTIKHDYEKTFTYLLEKGADVNKVSCDNGCTALHYAAQGAKFDFMQYLILYGADVNIANNNGETPLISVACNPKYGYSWRTVNCIKLLLKNGSVVNYVSNKGISATGGLLAATAIDVDRDEALKVLYVAGDTHKNVIMDPNEKIIVLQQPNRLDKIMTNSGLLFDPESQLDRSLMNFCRETIRKHLLHVHGNKSLFGLVPELPLASLIHEYLLYGVSLDLRVQMQSAFSSESAQCVI